MYKLKEVLKFENTNIASQQLNLQHDKTIKLLVEIIKGDRWK